MPKRPVNFRIDESTLEGFDAWCASWKVSRTEAVAQFMDAPILIPYIGDLEPGKEFDSIAVIVGNRADVAHRIQESSPADLVELKATIREWAELLNAKTSKPVHSGTPPRRPEPPPRPSDPRGKPPRPPGTSKAAPKTEYGSLLKRSK